MSQKTMAGPKIIADDSDFRIIEVGEGNGMRNILEVEDGCDALGVLRWREFRLENQKLRSMFGYLCRVVKRMERVEQETIANIVARLRRQPHQPPCLLSYGDSHPADECDCWIRAAIELVEAGSGASNDD